MQQRCPFCFEKNFTRSYLPNTFFNQKEFRYVRCVSCGLIYLDPFPEDEDFMAMYPPSYQSGIDKKILPDQEKKLPGLRFSYAKHFGLVNKLAPGKKILDYGCGTANFLMNARQNGFECDGVEYNARHVEVLKREIQGSSFFEVDAFLNMTGPYYDVIRLSNVLEHLPSPGEIIERLIPHLNPGGILLIEGPIETNPSLALGFRKIYFYLSRLTRKPGSVAHPPTHIFFSNARNQLDFFKKFAIEQLHYEITECPWPFPETFQEAHGAGDLIKFFIARCSRVFSRVFPSKLGNAFIYVGRKTTSS